MNPPDPPDTPDTPDPPTPRGATALLGSWALLAGGFALLTTGYFTLPLDVFGPGRPVLSWITFCVAIGGLTVLLVRKMLQVLTNAGGRPGIGLVFLTGLSLLVFAATYFALARQPGEFVGLDTRLDALYFTVITTSTVGYGDITPSGQSARLVVLLQIFYNFVFLAAAAGTISTRLRSQISSRLRHGRPHPGGPVAGPEAGTGPGGREP